MNNVRFLYNAAFDDAALTATPAGAVDPDWPLAWLQSTIRRQVMKTTGTGNITIRADLGANVIVSSLGLVEHDLNPDATVTVRAYSDEWITEIFSQSFEALGPIIPWGEGFWGVFNWYGYPSEEDLAAYPQMTGAYWLSQRLAARWWEIEIANGDGAENEFYLGRVLLSDYWEPTRNLLYGWELEPVDSSSDDESLGKVLFTDEGPQYYTARFKLGSVSDFEAYSHFVKLCRYVGTRRDFILQLTDLTPKQQKLTTLYGRFTKNPVLSSRARDLSGAEFIFREVV